MSKQRKVTVRLKWGKRGFHFLEDGSVNRKGTSYYTMKRSLIRGVARFMGNRPHTVVDETGRTWRNNPK